MTRATETVRGRVYSGSRNILTVRTEENPSVELECRIKGKVLKDAGDVYNPFAPGDWVLIEAHGDSAQILRVEERRNAFSRFNQKGGSSQLLAANVDLALCLCTPLSPPFRPRFLDRVLLQADSARIEPLIVCNKMDLYEGDLDVDERLEDFKRIGYKVLFVSAKTGEGLDELKAVIKGLTSVLIGQSGTGKSSLINALSPDLNVREGRINEKFDRGRHTTTMSYMIELPHDTYIIDTPGVRLFIPDGIKAKELISHMREFSALEGKCSYGISCSHKVEPGCKVMEAVHAGVIHEDRYDSFLSIYEALKGNLNDY